MSANRWRRALTSTPTGSASTVASASTSTSWKRWATRSPSNPPPDRSTHTAPAATGRSGMSAYVDSRTSTDAGGRHEGHDLGRRRHRGRRPDGGPPMNGEWPFIIGSLVVALAVVVGANTWALRDGSPTERRQRQAFEKGIDDLLAEGR